MSSNRRKFLRYLTIGTGALVAKIPSFASVVKDESDFSSTENNRQHFNMCGYAAPKLDTVRVGIIGLGNRGPGAVDRMRYIEGVQITALCDKYPDRVTKAQQLLVKAGLPAAKEYSGENGWKQLCESNEVDLVYICTPWSLHTPMAVHAMKHDKHTAVEVPAAKTIEECWQLVETSEKTRKHCMMLENCCYDFFEMLTLNMIRNGLFGEIIHAEGAYLHDLKEHNFSKTYYADMWRLRENASRNGNLYPTHGLGPIAQCMNINRGDKMDHLVSMSSKDFMMNEMAREKAMQDAFYSEFVDRPYRGNINTTLVHTGKGKTLMLQHDVTSTRPYSRIHVLSGTKGMISKYPTPNRIAFGHNWLKPEEMKTYEETYTPPLVKHIGEIAKEIGGHGGMDFMMDWRLIDCLRNGLPLDQDVYDAALWSVIAPLSEKSVAKKSRTMDVPDFTRGSWKTNQPHDLTLNGGATTPVRKIVK